MTADITTLAEDYLLNMHALELGAGFNFTRARRELNRRRFTGRDLLLDLQTAAEQEAYHAQLIQRMIYAVRFPNHPTVDLIRRARKMEKTFLAPWQGNPALPMIGILFNLHLEQHVVNIGLTTFTHNIKRLSHVLAKPRLAALAETFFHVVARDERSHVELNTRTLAQLEPHFGKVDIRAGQSIHRGPLASFVRVRVQLERALARAEAAAKPAGDEDQ